MWLTHRLDWAISYYTLTVWPTAMLSRQQREDHWRGWSRLTAKVYGRSRGVELQVVYLFLAVRSTNSNRMIYDITVMNTMYMVAAWLCLHYHSLQKLVFGSLSHYRLVAWNTHVMSSKFNALLWWNTSPFWARRWGVVSSQKKGENQEPLRTCRYNPAITPRDTGGFHTYLSNLPLQGNLLESPPSIKNPGIDNSNHKTLYNIFMTQSTLSFSTFHEKNIKSWEWPGTRLCKTARSLTQCTCIKSNFLHTVKFHAP